MRGEYHDDVAGDVLYIPRTKASDGAKTGRINMVVARMARRAVRDLLDERGLFLREGRTEKDDESMAMDGRQPSRREGAECKGRGV